MERVKILSSSSSFNTSDIGMVNFVSSILKNDLEFLKIIFFQTKDKTLKKNILESFIFLCKQNNIKTYQFYSGNIKSPYVNTKYVYTDDIYTIEKVKILSDILNFISMHSYDYNISNSIYSKYLNDYNPNLKIKEKFIVKDIIRDSFIFFLMYNNTVDKEKLKEKISFETVQKLFGKDVTLDQYQESLLSYIILLTKEKSLEKKIKVYNNNIVGDWFNKYKNYSIILVPITIDDITENE